MSARSIVEAHNLYFRNDYWIDPDGKLYPVPYDTHESWAENNKGMSIKELCRSGWRRIVTDADDTKTIFISDDYPNRIQRSKLETVAIESEAYLIVDKRTQPVDLVTLYSPPEDSINEAKEIPSAIPRKYHVEVITDLYSPSRHRDVEATSFAQAFFKATGDSARNFKVSYSEQHAVPTKNPAHAMQASRKHPRPKMTVST